MRSKSTLKWLRGNERRIKLRAMGKTARKRSNSKVSRARNNLSREVHAAANEPNQNVDTQRRRVLLTKQASTHFDNKSDGALRSGLGWCLRPDREDAKA